jgi:chromosome segregation ATPase
VEPVNEHPIAPETGTPPPHPRGRRVLRAVATLLFVAAAVTGVAVGWQQRDVAATWQARATILEQQRDDAVGRSEALSEELTELVEDLTALEARLAALAGEKAQAEDQATVSREDLRTLAERVDSAVRQLNACADDLFRLQSDTIDAYNSVARGTTVDVGPLNDRLRVMQERCTAARQAGAEAVALASRLR